MRNPDGSGDVDRRVLVFAPIGRDAELTGGLLARASIACAAFASLRELCRTFEQTGGGAILLTEEALDDPGIGELIATLARQPAWSDVPVLLFAGRADQEMALRTTRSLDALRNVTLLDRPIRIAAALSTIQSALRSRARQCEVRDLLVELRRARAEAESANRLKDEFLATLSHELRTPLNAILGWTSMLTRGQVEPGRMPQAFEALDRNAQSQAQLIADVLDVSRIITGKLQLQLTSVDMRDLVARALDSVRPAATAKNITLRVEEHAECHVRGDADRLQQVVWNILSNAIKFTPAGGAIQVVVECDGAQVSLSISDTGVGIEPEFVPYVFDRFRQADQTTTRTHGGLGLGLAIVKHLVELHGGTVTAWSEGRDRGACFRLVLPAEIPAPRRAVPGDEGEIEVSFSGCLVLVVDDDVSTREVVAAAFERAHARVDLAESAAQGMEFLQRRLPDLIVADLGMPAEDGFAFIARARRLSTAAQRVPAIALSAYADLRSQEAALAAGFTAFLAKPARPQTLLHLSRSLIGTRPATP